ncbi:hypothetical protein BJ165DRAFT_1463964 [Panaeolus papilionaceus]|nr:hypothetical protein BJ165DRAFT_1463964 [Panaeolus papilionaceus]
MTLQTLLLLHNLENHPDSEVRQALRAQISTTSIFVYQELCSISAQALELINPAIAHYIIILDEIRSSIEGDPNELELTRLKEKTTECLNRFKTTMDLCHRLYASLSSNPGGTTPTSGNDVTTRHVSRVLMTGSQFHITQNHYNAPHTAGWKNPIICLQYVQIAAMVLISYSAYHHFPHKPFGRGHPKTVIL